LVRARFFAPSYGVPEDEATGSAALRLVAQLARPIVITQGRGSVIHARPAVADSGYAEIGGRVMGETTRMA
jgi:predicted PhzF superfamily epimerase YddE/YHI9